MVRSTLQALIASEYNPKTRADEQTPSTSVPILPAEPSVHFEVALGWAVSADGETFGPHGPGIRVGRTQDNWTFSVLLEMSLREQLSDEFTTIDLLRYRAALGAHVWVWHQGPFFVAAGGTAGAIWVRRTTTEAKTTVEAAPPKQTLAFSVGAEARIAVATTEWFRIELSGGLVLEIGSPFRVFCDRRECPGEILQDHPHQGLKIVSERRSFPATRVVRHVKAPKMHRVTTKAKVLDGIALWSRLDDDRNAMFTGAEMLGARGV